MTISSPSFFSMSRTRFSNPLTSDSPSVSMALDNASGLVPRKLAGLIMSMICWEKNLIRRFSRSSKLSMSLTALDMASAFKRYWSFTSLKYGCVSHNSFLKRASLGPSASDSVRPLSTSDFWTSIHIWSDCPQ